MTICVRMARPEDADSIRQVGDQAFEPVHSLYRPNPAALANLSAMVPAVERMLAELDGKVVGTVRYGVVDDCLRVIGLAVLPRFQRPAGQMWRRREMPHAHAGLSNDQLLFKTLRSSFSSLSFFRAFRVFRGQFFPISINVRL